MRVCLRIRPDEKEVEPTCSRGNAGESVVVIGNTIAVRHRHTRKRSSVM